MSEFGSRAILRLLIRHSLIRGIIGNLPGTRLLARRFVAGKQLDDAVHVIDQLNAAGIEATLNHLGTHVRTLPGAVAAADLAIRSIDRIHRDSLHAHLSIKLTQIGLDLCDEVCHAQLDRILEQATRLSVFVRIDMEESTYVNRTLAIFDEVQQRFGVEAVGIVVQSYLKDAHVQIERLLASGSRIRLVKGGYWEPPGVVYPTVVGVDRAFQLDCATLMSRGVHPTIATHDPNAIHYVRELASKHGIDTKSFEVEMLYGVRFGLAQRLLSEGVSVRIYVPYGAQWYDYTMGCLRKLLLGITHRGRRTW